MGKGEEMELPKLGPWHKASVKPVHVGVYEVDMEDEDGRAFSKWDGSNWMLVKWEAFGKGTVQDAIERASKEMEPVSDRECWRGVLR